MNVADLLDRDTAYPLYIVGVPDLPADWRPTPGAVVPGAVDVLRLEAPAWERARRLLEGDD